MNELKSLIRQKCKSIRELSEKTGISSDTINRRLKDGDWRLSECDILIKALDIPVNMFYIYFFEERLEQNSKKVTT